MPPAVLACRLPPGLALRDLDGLVWANLGTERRPIAALLVTPEAIRLGGAALGRLPADVAATAATAEEAGWISLASAAARERSPTPSSPAAEPAGAGHLGDGEEPDWSPSGSPAYVPLAARRTMGRRGRSRSRGRQGRGSERGRDTRASERPARRAGGGRGTPTAPPARSAMA